MRLFLLALASIFSFQALAVAAKTFPFSFHDAPLEKVLGIYSAATGQRFVVDSPLNQSVKITILQPGRVTASEAFNLLSASLALNGVAISSRGNMMVLAAARNVQRSLIPVVTDIGELQPERLETWVINLKHADPNNIMQQLRTLTSKEGEITAYGPNRMMITDWTSNLFRVRGIIEQVDKDVPAAPPAPLK